MASNRIKGLTVEIGGDTTKLGKALKNVEEKSKSLSGELSQINRLLKLDPTNTELLAQKHKVLTEAVATTKAKLDKLREAEASVRRTRWPMWTITPTRASPPVAPSSRCGSGAVWRWSTAPCWPGPTASISSVARTACKERGRLP